MSFLSGATHTDASHSFFTAISGSQTNINGGIQHIYISDQVLNTLDQGHIPRKRRRSSASSTSDVDQSRIRAKRQNCRRERDAFIRSEDVRLQKLLRTSSGYQIHSAQFEGQVVAVKVFNGRHAEANLKATELFYRRIMHSNILRVSAISSPDAHTPFIVFDSAFGGSVECMIAAELRAADLKRSILLGMKMIHGLSSGLHYLEIIGIPLALVGIENYEVFMDSDNKVVVGVNPMHLDKAHSTRHLISDGALDVFNRLCQNTFRATNSVLYRDDVARGERSTDSLSAPSHMSPGWVSDDLLPQDGPAPSESTELTPQKTRRELVWTSLEQQELSLAIVAKQFGDFLDVFSPTPSRTLLQRRIGSDARKTVHRCPGYNREEIIFTTSVYNSAVISHTSPSLREICVVCGKSVQGGEVFRCVCGEEDDGFRATIECAVCFTWHHIQCIGIQELPSSGFVCQFCTGTQIENIPARTPLNTVDADPTAPGDGLPTGPPLWLTPLTIPGDNSMTVRDADSVPATIYRPEATYSLDNSPIGLGGSGNIGPLALGSSNGFSDEEMLATMQALKNPQWWSTMMMPGFSWPHDKPSQGGLHSGLSHSAFNPASEKVDNALIYRPEATHTLGSGSVEFRGPGNIELLAPGSSNGFSDEEMLATMQALKNPQ